jgi:soluble lytic murein transglycosylase
MEALISAGNAQWVLNHADRYLPFYKKCYESFPGQPEAAVCHWRVTWNTYLERRPEAKEMLQAHLRLFPSSEQANAALYFLGRLEETAGNPAGANGYYSEIDRRYPNSYYAMLARQRLADPKIGKVQGEPPTLLRDVSFPVRRRQESFQPEPATKTRIERASLLTAIGFYDMAESELRFGAKLGEQPHVLAIELAKVATHRGSPDQGIRYVKTLVPNYLWFDFSGTPASFWKLAFPIPYRLSVEKWAKQNGLDPFLMAGLIRQESEFNPKALSRAKAYGLTQVLPSTGRSLARSAGMPRFSASMLYQPDVNLRLGSMYFKSLMGSHNGKVEYSLASYNAGKSRTDLWSTWANFRDPAEFVESVPFSETRNYIQQVMRNADLYQRLYAGTTAEVTSVNGDAPAKTSSQPAAKKKPAAPVRKRTKR